MIRKLLLSALLVWLTSTHAQQMQLEIIPLKNRTAEQIIEVVKPLMPPGATISGMNNQLIVKSTPGNLAEIKQLLNSIDQRQRRLLISVSNQQDLISTDQSQSISGQIDSGSVSICNRQSRIARDQRTIISGADSEGNRISYSVNNHQTTTTSSNTYTVQTLDGQPAFIQSGLSVPIQNQQAFINQNGVVVQDTVEYISATSGFYELPRVNGDRVTPNQTAVRGQVTPTFVVQNAQTTVSGGLGEWIQIGGLNTASGNNNRGILSDNQSKQTDSRTILIKVEEIR